MHPEYKLIRFSNGEQVIGEVVEEKAVTINIRNMYKVISRETSHGYVTGVVGWLSYAEDKIIKLNKEHITFISSVSEEIVEYLKHRENEPEERMTVEDMEQQYKEAMMDYYLHHANTNPTMQ